MAILSKGTTYADGDQITSTNLNALVDNATFDANAVSNGVGLNGSGQLEVVGNIDIGTSNLTATGAISLGATTFNDNNITNVGSIAVDTIIADDTDITIDAAGDIILDAGGADILLKDDGTQFGSITKSGSDIVVASSIADIILDAVGDIILDADGAQVRIKDAGTERFVFNTDSTPELDVTGTSFTIHANTSDADMFFRGNDGGSDITALKLDMSSSGDATFNNKVIATELDIGGDVDVAGTTNLDVVDIDGAVNMATTALVTGVLTTTATQVATGGITSGSSILSDTDSTDSLGSTAVRWLKGWFDTLTAGTLTIGAGSVTDSSGAISFGNENLTTTGTVTAAGTSVFTNLDISGDVDVDGTTNLDVVDIDGAVDMATTLAVTGASTLAAISATTGSFSGAVSVTNAALGLTAGYSLNLGPVGMYGSGSFIATSFGGVEKLRMDSGAGLSVTGAVTVGVNDTGHDVKFFGATSGAYMHWDESTDDLILGGVARLGIGTTTPSAPLEVMLGASEATSDDTLYRTALFGLAQSNMGSLEFKSGRDDGATSGRTSSIQAWSNQESNAVSLALNPSGGNVGIGTTSPVKKVHIASDANSQTTATIPGIRIENTDTTASDTNVAGEIEFFSKDASEADKISGFIKNVAEDAGTKYALTFGAKASGANAAERMRIDADGNVGIGITSPNSKLTIVGDDAETAAINTATATTLEVAGNGTSSNSGGAVIFSAASGAWKFAAIKGLVVSGTANTVGDLAFSTRNATGDSTLTERMRILYGGNVGIGTTSPSQLLHVKSLTSSGGYINYDGQSNTEFGLRIESNSNGGNFEGDEANNGSLLDLFANSSATSGGDILCARTQSSTSVFLVRGNGRVGIGVNAPSYTLDVNGDTGINGDAYISAGTSSRTAVQFANPVSSLCPELRMTRQGGSTSGNDFIKLDTSAGEVFSVDAAGGIDCDNILATSGIAFGTDTAAANQLDDYEEGTWTPVITFGGASVGVAYSTPRLGTYTKIGRLVTATCSFLLSDKGSSTGHAVITGLPFASSSASGNNTPPFIRVGDISFADFPMGLNGPGLTTVTLFEAANSGTVSTITEGNFSNSSQIQMAISYAA